ncbi:MAG TPA: glycoside hydrolase family 3 N-terminal domain-containing protein [Streptosporangiaceae bacterium]|nr:glycoside hydrolase family 3 N-terminal domain-containing protein [Streptosporangiaceae bacterium]
MRQQATRPKHAASGRAVAPLALVGGLVAAATAALAAWALTSTLTSTGAARGPNLNRTVSGAPVQTSHPATAVTAAPPLPKLSPAQMAGQRIIYSYAGLTPPASLLGWISHGEVGGIIFFAPNISSDSQLAHVVAELDAANSSKQNPLRSFPLLLMTDQEGGLVRRLPGAPFLSEKQIGESADPGGQAQTAGTGAARNLAAAGMNVNLAPVLDIYRTPGDFDDQFGRSYSSNPQVVADLGARFIKAQQALRVAATAKHFPGLGTAASSQNTDLGPVTLNASLRTLRGTDERPYRAAIAAGVKLVMVSWAVYPALAPGVPAGLSSAVVQGELRKRLHFTGVTITDALEAGALRPIGSIQRRAAMAASAGMDLILCSDQNPTEGEQARAGLEDSYRTGALARATSHAALGRIIDLRSSLRP